MNSFHGSRMPPIKRSAKETGFNKRWQRDDRTFRKPSGITADVHPADLALFLVFITEDSSGFLICCSEPAGFFKFARL